MCDISIVIPVYNAESTIERAVESAFSSQKLHIEVIVVDDGSNDNTRHLLEKLKSRYSSLFVISQKNGGPSLARRAGIELAKGDYIAFLDADDYLENGAYDIVSGDIVLNKIDVMEFSYRVVASRGDLIRNVRLSPIEHTEDVYCRYVSDLHRTNAIWNKIFHRRLFKQIEYPSLKMGEDLCLNLQLMFNAKAYKRYPVILYNYIVYENSLSHDIDFYRAVDDVKAGEFFLFFNDERANYLNDYALAYLITKIIQCKESITDKPVLSQRKGENWLEGKYETYAKRFYSCLSHKELFKYYLCFKIYDYLGMDIAKVKSFINRRPKLR